MPFPIDVNGRTIEPKSVVALLRDPSPDRYRVRKMLVEDGEWFAGLASVMHPFKALMWEPCERLLVQAPSYGDRRRKMAVENEDEPN